MIHLYIAGASPQDFPSFSESSPRHFQTLRALQWHRLLLRSFRLVLHPLQHLRSLRHRWRCLLPYIHRRRLHHRGGAPYTVPIILHRYTNRKLTQPLLLLLQPIPKSSARDAGMIQTSSHLHYQSPNKRLHPYRTPPLRSDIPTRFLHHV